MYSLRTAILSLCLLFTVGSPAQKNSPKPDAGAWYTVIRVVDGDTFWVDDGSEKGLKIRLIGVDAPETHNTGKKLKGYYGEESASYLTDLIGGRKVRLEYDVSRHDRYGRTLAYAWLRDGTFVNKELVRNGYATVMTVPPNVKYADDFAGLARQARIRNKGLWNNITPENEK